MSLIGTLEQMSLANLLQRLESFAKSGLLIVQQGAQWVELYFRDGRLICIGPVRTSTNLGMRLLQEGYISLQALHETMQTLAGKEPTETQVAVTLMNLGYTSQEQLREWATRKASEVLQVLLSWNTGDLHFEEQVQPPAERLLVAVTVSHLLPSLLSALQQNAPGLHPSASAPSHTPQTGQLPPASGPLQPQLTRASEIPNVPTLMSASQFGLEPGIPPQQQYAALNNQKQPTFFTPPPAPMNNAIFTPEAPVPSAVREEVSREALAFFESGPVANGAQEGFVSIFGGAGNEANDDSPFVSFLEEGNAESASGRRPPEPVMTPFVPKRIDTSFMRPEMLLLPMNFSAGLAQNPSVQITPEQWMVLTQVDGQTSLQNVCLALSMPPTQVCQIVGELLAEGVIQVSSADTPPLREPVVPGRESVAAGMNTGYIAPGYASMAVPSWSQPLPDAGFGGAGFEVQSQWGNSGNGANFIPGQGWTATPQPLQPLQTSRPAQAYPHAYAPVGGNR